MANPVLNQHRKRLPKKAECPAAPASAPDDADLSCGPYPNNKLDLWLAKSNLPAPRSSFSFTVADSWAATRARRAAPQSDSAAMPASLFASINYRFCTEVPINTILRDFARAIQFLRSKAAEFKFDRKSATAFGVSAGAGTSLWLSFHNDLADFKSDDPVLRESPRLLAAASTSEQATYDILKWRVILGSDEAMRFYPEATWPEFYGLET